MTISELISNLTRFGVEFSVPLSGDWQIRVPWEGPGEIPAPAWDLLLELKDRGEEVNEWFKRQAVILHHPVSLHPARRECLEANGCLWLSMNCDWYAVVTQDGLLTGVCRDRIKMLH